MVAGPKARILARLASFPPSLESAWDVPREICLPGLSEYLGVVRSALHPPLNDLVSKGLVIERKAHVIGAGSRRRKVYHITELGRSECENIVLPVERKLGELLGNPPSETVLQGRDELISKIKSKDKMILTGLPGIGKTSLLRAIADELVKDGKKVRFATMESFKDITQIFADWEFEYTSENAVLQSAKNDVLIIDELQEISQRHLARVEMFANKSRRMIIASRAPLPIKDGFDIIEVPPLEPHHAAKLLPPHLEDKEVVAERLGGHPLALQMFDEESILPESGSDLQKWVQEVVISKLGEELKLLDELSLLPVPVPVKFLQHENYLFDLDDFALMRWHKNGVELHHLVRNVRSTMLTKQDYSKAANYWAQLDGDLARLVEMHHILNCDGDVESLLMKNAESLMIRSSSGLASLIGDAIFRHPTTELHRIAAMVAIERGEGDLALHHLSQCDAPDLEYSARFLNGENQQEIPIDADPRLLLSEASRRMDDRLPGTNVTQEVIELLDRIDFSAVKEEMRSVILVAMAHVRHAWFISEKKWDEASKIRINLQDLTHQKDPQIVAMELRAEIAQTPANTPHFEKLVDSAFSKKGLRASMLQLSIIEKCDPTRAKSLLGKIELPSTESQSSISAARRVAAMIWYHRGVLNTHNQLSAISEAISLWKRSLCPNAAKDATEIMHGLL